MPRDAAGRPVTADQLTTIMDDAARVLSARLPDESRADIDRVVYEVTTELVSTITDAQRLSTMLRLRATARLSALSGNPVPIRRG